MTDTANEARKPPKSQKPAKGSRPIRPPCILVGLDGNAWSVIGRVNSALRAAGRDDMQPAAVMTTMCASFDQTLSLALSLVTPVELEHSYSAKWRPFFHAHSTRTAFQKACASPPIWQSQTQTLADFLAAKGDLGARDAFGRDWLFFAREEKSSGDFDAALAQTPKPLSRDSMGLPFFIHGLAPSLTAKAFAASSAEDAAAACAPDEVCGASPSVWLMACLYKDAMGLGKPSAAGAADCLEALRLKGLAEIQGACAKDLTADLRQSFTLPKGKQTGASDHAATRLAAELALLSQDGSGSAFAQQLKSACAAAAKADPAVAALVERVAYDLSLPSGSPSSRRAKSV